MLVTMSMLSFTIVQTRKFPGTHYVDLLAGKKRYIEKPEPLKGFKRVLKLLILCFLLPLLLLIYPLYLRNRVYIQQIYPVGVSDMRIIDNKISTTWCQRQVINSNTTFNAYVIANEPQISRKIEKVDMHRSMVLKDGAKEYWGFYLLKGSSFNVSACVRWPGATLIIIEGHKNLKECAYVGDNSSEETDDSISSEEARNVSVINQMTKIAPGIILNKRWKLGQSIHMTISEKATEDYAVRLGLSRPEEKTKNIHLKYAEDLFHKDRKKNGDKEAQTVPVQTKNETKSGSDSVEVVTDILNRLKSLGPKGRMVIQRLQNQTTIGSDTTEELLTQIDQMIREISIKSGRSKSRTRSKNETGLNDEGAEFNNLRREIMVHRDKLAIDNETNAGGEVFDESDKADVHVSLKNTKNGDHSKSEFWSSFSSSEERLISCKGLLTSLPLVPYQKCDQKYDKKQLDDAADINSIFYKILSDGYYFFIFNNENEVERNFIYAHFQINKTVYDTSEAVVSCRNQSKECALPLTFWSKERTVLELPHPTDDAEWNEEYIFVTHCEPRSILYVICVMSVLVGILLFAFS